MIEDLFLIRQRKFEDYPAVIEALDIVEEEDQITHDELSLDAQYDDEVRAMFLLTFCSLDFQDLQKALNLFHFDLEYKQHEEEYDSIRKEILGDSESSSESSDSDSDSSDSSSDSEKAKPGSAGMLSPS